MLKHLDYLAIIGLIDSSSFVRSDFFSILYSSCNLGKGCDDDLSTNEFDLSSFNFQVGEVTQEARLGSKRSKRSSNPNHWG